MADLEELSVARAAYAIKTASSILGQGVFQRLNQGRRVKWLVQARGRAERDETLAKVAIAVRRNEDDWNGPRAYFQLLEQFRSAHTGHGDIKDNALRRVDNIRRQKRFRGVESAGVESERAQQCWNRFPDRFIIVDDGYEHVISHESLQIQRVAEAVLGEGRFGVAGLYRQFAQFTAPSE